MNVSCRHPIRTGQRLPTSAVRTASSEFCLPNSEFAPRRAPAHRASGAHRPAFTLVELLVVIAIIGILASLITVAAANALWASKQTKIKVETDNLSMAIEAFKSKYGSYPPANLVISGGSVSQMQMNNPNLVAFIARAFPRYPLASLATDLGNAGVNTTTFSPQQALVFWLSGFSPDVTQPFTGGGQRTPLFDFDRTRLYDAQGGGPITANTPVGRMVYNAPYGNAAYAYFDANSYGTVNPPNASPNTSAAVITGTGTPAPYIADTNNNGTIDVGEGFAKPQSFQIISAGQDGNFGAVASAKLYPTGTNYDPTGADDDNVANFCERHNLNDARP